jgi:hypothetical protein
MIFASRTSSGLPWQVGQSVTVIPVQGGSIVTRLYTQHNDPNPVLIHFRESGQHVDEYLRDRILHGWPSPMHFEMEHARRVLTRLARMKAAS